MLEIKNGGLNGAVTMTTYPFSADPDHSSGGPRRRVRSFVLRTGRMTPAQNRALSELWPRYGIDFLAEALDLNACFGREAPRLLEIGFGTGDALLAYAQAHPDWDCLGIEVHLPGVGHLLLGVESRQLRNVRVLRHDAVEVLGRQLQPASLNEVHIFFPDPWPKKRHHKRRLVQPEFVGLLGRVLTSDGILRLATDWEPYAEQIRSVLDSHALFENLGGSQGQTERPADRPVTRFERRGQRLGHGVWDFAYRRR